MEPTTPEPTPQMNPEAAPEVAAVNSPDTTAAPVARPSKVRRLAPVLGLVALLGCAAFVYWPAMGTPITRSTVPHPSGDTALATEVVTMHKKGCSLIGPDVEWMAESAIPKEAIWCGECTMTGEE